MRTCTGSNCESAAPRASMLPIRCDGQDREIPQLLQVGMVVGPRHIGEPRRRRREPEGHHAEPEASRPQGTTTAATYRPRGRGHGHAERRRAHSQPSQARRSCGPGIAAARRTHLRQRAARTRPPRQEPCGHRASRCRSPRSTARAGVHPPRPEPATATQTTPLHSNPNGTGHSSCAPSPPRTTSPMHRPSSGSAIAERPTNSSLPP